MEECMMRDQKPVSRTALAPELVMEKYLKSMFATLRSHTLTLRTCTCMLLYSFHKHMHTCTHTQKQSPTHKIMNVCAHMITEGGYEPVFVGNVAIYSATRHNLKLEGKKKEEESEEESRGMGGTTKYYW